MTTSPIDVRVDDAQLWVELSDGRTIGVPLAWFPRLCAATPAQRAAWTLSPMGVHWEELDEDVSIDGLFAGRADQTRRPGRAA